MIFRNDSCKPFRATSVALSAVLVISACVLTSCGNDKSVTFKSSGMTTTFSEGGEGIPQDLKALVYPGSQVAGSTAAHDQEGENSAFLSLSSQDGLEQVAEWYRSELQKNGWTIDNEETMPRMLSISGKQKEVEINVLMVEDGDKTTISVSEGKSVDDSVEEEEIEKFTPNDLTPPTE